MACVFDPLLPGVHLHASWHTLFLGPIVYIYIKKNNVPKKRECFKLFQFYSLLMLHGAIIYIYIIYIYIIRTKSLKKIEITYFLLFC